MISKLEKTRIKPVKIIMWLILLKFRENKAITINIKEIISEKLEIFLFIFLVFKEVS